jgi:ribonuclease-3
LIRELFNTYMSDDKDFVVKLRSVLGFVPKNVNIFKLAFYHKSAIDNPTGFKQNNERLEYLGDSILNSIVAEYLFKKYPTANEGFLTKMRSKIVKRKTLNELADQMGLDVLLSEYNNTHISKSMLGNAFEALVGAIYLEKGYGGTRDLIINRVLREYINFERLEVNDDNYKSQLLEWCQKQGKEVDFRMLQKYRFEKRDRFKVGVFIDGSEVSTAEDFNKKSAEQIASGKAVNKLGLKVVS